MAHQLAGILKRSGLGQGQGPIRTRPAPGREEEAASTPANGVLAPKSARTGSRSAPKSAVRTCLCVCLSMHTSAASGKNAATTRAGQWAVPPWAGNCTKTRETPDGLHARRACKCGAPEPRVRGRRTPSCQAGIDARGPRDEDGQKERAVLRTTVGHAEGAILPCAALREAAYDLPGRRAVAQGPGVVCEIYEAEP